MRIFGIGIQELLVILLICLILFGAAKLPEIGKAMGNTIKEFKKSIKWIGSEDDKEIKVWVWNVIANPAYGEAKQSRIKTGLLRFARNDT